MAEPSGFRQPQHSDGDACSWYPERHSHQMHDYRRMTRYWRGWASKRRRSAG